jgi:hypothetical protein
MRQGLFIVAIDGPGRIAQTAKIWRDHAVPFGQSWNDVTPHEPCLRPPVQQHYGWSVTAGDVVQAHIAKVSVVVLER